MPGLGDPNAPVHKHVTPHYIQRAAEEIGMPNMVTAVLASYRGYDTFGETLVVFTAGLAVLLLLAQLQTLLILGARIGERGSAHQHERGKE